jgi:hypothetical protein
MKEEFRTEAHPDLTQAAPHYLSQFSLLQKKLLTHQNESSLPWQKFRSETCPKSRNLTPFVKVGEVRDNPRTARTTA